MFNPFPLCSPQFIQLHSTVTRSLAHVTKIKIINGLDYFFLKEIEAIWENRFKSKSVSGKKY